VIKVRGTYNVLSHNGLLYFYIIIIIIIIHPHSLLHSRLAGCQKSTGLTDQAILIYCSAKNFGTKRHVLSRLIAAFCNGIYTDQDED
jgi:hypothetical protein